MAIIIRNNGQKRDQGDKKKQLYTWVGCGLVTVLTLISVIPNMGGEQKAPDYGKFSSQRMQDLAAMPFGTDAEASSFLQNNPEYAEVSNADLLGSLFSSEDRKERQAQDKAEGVPPPPDPEYREIAREKEKAEEAKAIQEARIQRKFQARENFNKAKEKAAKSNKKTANQKQQVRNQKTTPGTLGSSGSRMGSGGGSSSVTGSIWRYEGKDVKGTTNNIAGNHTATAQDVAFAKDKGRNVGLDVAAIESMKGANAESADAAAAGAIDAFQGEVAPEDLAKDEEELGLEELPQGLNEDLQDELKREIGEDVNKQESNRKNSSDTHKGKEYNINENCLDSNGHFVWKCALSNFGTNLLNKGIDCAFSGCWNNWKGSNGKGFTNVVIKDKDGNERLFSFNLTEGTATCVSC